MCVCVCIYSCTLLSGLFWLHCLLIIICKLMMISVQCIHILSLDLSHKVDACSISCMHVVLAVVRMTAEMIISVCVQNHDGLIERWKRKQMENLLELHNKTPVWNDGNYNMCVRVCACMHISVCVA